ncbi:MAG: DUF4262 domain-containing protein [Labilithrix sp.]|nr:DUF4262 domain-containing protein [Labilithrix sp.]
MKEQKKVKKRTVRKTTLEKRAVFLELIRQNVATYGRHIYLVSGDAWPRYAYTIGLTETLGSELILAGGIYYMAESVHRVINVLADRLENGCSVDSVMSVEGLGAFALGPTRDEWVEQLMLGAVDYYRGRPVAAHQVLPAREHSTIDVPVMSEPLASPVNRAWRWLAEEWPYSVPRRSTATTNLAALRGAPITEAARWEEEEWELFAGPGPDVERQDVRVVPLGVLLGHDETLNAVVNLAPGQGLWRDEGERRWHPWGATK